MNHMPLEVSLIGIAKVLAAALVGALVVFLTAGCNGIGDDATDRPSGSAAIVISALSSKDVVNATVSITASDISVPITATLGLSNGWQATVGGIPAGAGRTFTLSATDANDVELYHGATNNVTIAADETASVNIAAQQTSQSAAFADAVPVIDLAQASSNNVAPGAVVNLNVTAHDPDPGDSLTYMWTTSTGTFASRTAQSTTWTAPTTLGTYPITIAVSDSKQEVTTATLQITVTTPPPQVPIPPYVTALLAGLLAAVGGLLSRREQKRCPALIRR